MVTWVDRIAGSSGLPSRDRIRYRFGDQVVSIRQSEGYAPELINEADFPVRADRFLTGDAHRLANLLILQAVGRMQYDRGTLG